MQFYELINHIKSNGCHVRLYNKLELKECGCVGNFDITKIGRPLINLAIVGHTQEELLQFILHEYAHFLQWKSGFLKKVEDICHGWDIFDRWLKGEVFSKEQLQKVRNSMIIIEYDAEIRTIELSSQLNVDIGSHTEYMKLARSYITLIKWSIINHSWGAHPGGEYFDKGLLTPTQVLKTITNKEISLF